MSKELPDWLHDSLDVSDVSTSQVVIRLASAFVLGGVVAGIAAFSHNRPRNLRTSYLAMLVLLTVLIAMTTIVIGNSPARAFSLVGALAIVRFRTVIQDMRDTAFVICAVGVGLSAGSGQTIVGVLGLPFVATTAWLFRTQRAPRKQNETVEIRLSNDAKPDETLAPVFAAFLVHHQLTETDKNGKGTHLELHYSVRFKPDADHSAFVQALNALPAVQKVKMKQKKD